MFARVSGASGILLPRANTRPDGRFQLNLAEGASRAELTIMAPGFLFYRQTVAVSEERELPIVLEQDGGGTLVIQPRAPITFEDGPSLPYVVRTDGTVLELGILSQWSALNHTAQVGNTLAVPNLPPGVYSVCWPRSPPQAGDGHDCRQGDLSANGRLEIAEPRNDSEDEPSNN